MVIGAYEELSTSLKGLLNPPFLQRINFWEHKLYSKDEILTDLVVIDNLKNVVKSILEKRGKISD